MKACFHSVLMLTIAFLITGCADKAEEPYHACESWEAKGDFATALSTCKRAAEADPNSKFGKLATDKVGDLQKRTKAKEEQDAKDAAARQEAATKAKRAQEEADAKCTDWVTLCNTGGPAPRFRSRADCEKGAKEFSEMPGV